MPDGFDSAHMRLRDQKIAEKHQEEISKVERRYRSIEAAYKNARNELYDYRQRADRFARRLGFQDLVDGEYQLANAEVQETYEQALARLEEKERELERANARIEMLEEDRMLWEQAGKGKEREGQGCTNDDSGACSHKEELQALQTNFEELQNNFARAQERYKKDYAKMRAHMRFMRGDDGPPGTRQATQNVLKRRREVKEEEMDMPTLDDLDEVMGPGFLTSVDDLEQRMRSEKRVAKDKKRRVPLGDRENAAPNAPTTPPKIGGAVPTFTLSTPQRKVPRPAPLPQPPSPSVTEESTQSPTRSKATAERPPVVLVPDSSVISIHSSPPSVGPSRLPKAEPESPQLDPSRPPQLDRHEKQPRRGRRSDIGPHTRTSEEPPRKMRRLSDGAQRTHGGQALLRLKAEVDDEDTTLIGEDRTFVQEGKSRNHDSPIVKADHKGKGRADPSTPATSSDSRKALLKSKAETDYSKFKGRGRYGKEREREKDAGNATINSLFEIDRTRNNGADFQFEYVVRGRESRKRLEATDCECCREYYEAVGPLPARPQGPLWRSPSRSPRKHRPECQHHQGHLDQEERRDEEVQAHRQAISRHRQQWARAKTPPGYWEIGFPSTQEVTEMNERAREMHRDKLKVVEAEARKDGGRYRRR